MAPVPLARVHAREAENRAIAIAFLASIALHLLLLVAWPTLRDPAKRAEFSPGPIIARLLAPQPAAPVAPTSAPPAEGPGAPKPEPELAPPRVEAPVAAAAPGRASKPRPLSAAMPKPLPGVDLEPAAPESRMPEAPATPAAPAVSARPAEAVGPTPSTAAPALDAPFAAQAPVSPGMARKSSASDARAAPAPPRVASLPEAADAATLAQYRLAVIETARRYKRYPRVALDNNWEGRAEVHMEIRPDGALATLAVRASTGHEVLDREALDMIRQAKAQTPVPAGLRGRKFAIEIPVIFSLRDPGA